MQQVVSVAGHESSREYFARLVERVTYVSLLVLLAWTAIPYGSVEFWWTSFFELGVFIIGVLWAVEALLREDYQSERWRWLAIPAAVLIVFCLVQSIPFGQSANVAGIDRSIRYAISADPFETRSFALRFGATALLAVLLLRFVNNRSRLQALVLTVIGIGAASALFGIIRQGMQRSEIGFLLPALRRGLGYGQIISRNQFAFLMEITFGLALGMIFSRDERLERRLLYAALSLPMAVALILANSRGGILTLMCEVLVLALIVITRPWVHQDRKVSPRATRNVLKFAARGLIVAALLGVTSLAVVWVGGERVTNNLSTVGEELKPEDGPARWNTRRVDIWKATWRMIKDRPVAGVGLGGYWIAVTPYHDASGAYTPQQAHNDYLELLASGGIIGLAICVWLLIVFVKHLKFAAQAASPFRRAAWCGAVVGLVGVAVHSVVDFGLHLTINGALCAALIAIGTANVADGSNGRGL